MNNKNFEVGQRVMVKTGFQKGMTGTVHMKIQDAYSIQVDDMENKARYQDHNLQALEMEVK